MLNEKIEVINIDGNNVSVDWRSVLEHPADFASVPTWDPFLFIPLTMMATAVNSRAATLGLKVADYLSKYDPPSRPLSRLQNAPTTDKQPGSYKAPYELKHDSSTVPNFFYHENPTRFGVLTRSFISSVIPTNGTPTYSQRSPWFDGTYIPIGGGTLLDTIGAVAKTIRNDTKPVWEYTDFNDYCSACNKYIESDSVNSYELALLPLFELTSSMDIATGLIKTNLLRVSKDHIVVSKVELYKDASIKPPYVYVLMRSPGQGSVDTWYMHEVRDGNLWSKPHADVRGQIGKLKSLDGKKATTHNKNNANKLLDGLVDGTASIVRREVRSDACGEFAAMISEMFNDSVAIKMCRNGDWSGLSKRYEIKTPRGLVEFVLNAYIKVRKVGDVNVEGISKPTAVVNRSEMLKLLCADRVDPGLCFVVYMKWWVARYLLIDFKSINSSLTDKQTLCL